MSSGIEALVNREYAYGFVTDVETDTVPPGLNEDIIRTISAKKNEPEFMLQWRLKAYRRWLTMKEPHWGNVRYPAIDYNSLVYYSAPKSVKPLQSLDEVDPELLRTYEKLCISLNEQKMLAGVAVQARNHLLLFRRSSSEPPRAGREIPRHRRPAQRQFLRGAERRGFQRRIVRLRPKGREVPDGAVDLLP